MEAGRRYVTGRARVVHCRVVVFVVGVTVVACTELRGPVLSEPAPDAGSSDAASSDAAGSDAATPHPASSDAACEHCTAPSFTIRGEQPTAQVGGTTGRAYVDLCPAGHVLIGYLGELRDISATAAPVISVTALRALCGAPLAHEPADVQIAPAEALSTRGEPSYPENAAWSQRCPPAQAIVGVEGRAGLAIDQLAFVCASVRAPGSQSESPTQTITLATAGGTGGDAFRLQCPEGQLARGHSVRAGRWLDAYALVCGTPAFRELPLDAPSQGADASAAP